jgi:hypothetical protein
MEKCVTLLDSKSPIQAVRMSPGEIEPRTRRWKNASPCLTQKAPYKGLGAESEEKREPASDIDTGAVDGLKVLDPEWPIREADLPILELLPPPASWRMPPSRIVHEGASALFRRMLALCLRSEDSK